MYTPRSTPVGGLHALKPPLPYKLRSTPAGLPVLNPPLPYKPRSIPVAGLPVLNPPLPYKPRSTHAGLTVLYTGLPDKYSDGLTVRGLQVLPAWAGRGMGTAGLDAPRSAGLTAGFTLRV